MQALSSVFCPAEGEKFSINAKDGVKGGANKPRRGRAVTDLARLMDLPRPRVPGLNEWLVMPRGQIVLDSTSSPEA